MGEDPWSYAQLQRLVQVIKEEAKTTLGREDFKVGFLMLGWSSIYYGLSPFWFRAHRESYRWGRQNRTEAAWLFLDHGATLRPDEVAYASQPSGLPPGVKLYQHFAAQWKHVSEDMGFDAILLRDGMLGLSNYRHASPEWDDRCFEGLRSLLKEIKTQSPATITMGYSVAGSAMAELRCHSFDLRTLAQDGYLDVWITQSWGCNWIEQKRLELTPAMQVATLATHRALLEGTGVKHYPVYNLLDAFEYLTCKSFQGRWQALRWEIWAYTHTVLRRYWERQGTWSLGEGSSYSMASGSYGAMFHIGQEMLEEESVNLFVHTLDAAVADARQCDEVGGYQLVVHDDLLRQWNKEGDLEYHGEHVDELAGLMLRAGLPVMCSSRVKEHDHSKSELPLLVHHPRSLPLDLLEDLRCSDVALLVDDDQDHFQHVEHRCDPQKLYDPFGDARRLRYEAMPEELRETLDAMKSSFAGPKIGNAAEEQIYFLYWSSGGRWTLMFANVEPESVDREVELKIPLAWLSERNLEGRLKSKDGPELRDELELNDQFGERCYKFLLASTCSCVLELF